MRSLLLVSSLMLGGCVSTSQFAQGPFECAHTVSTKLMGTAQVVSCNLDGSPAFVSSFAGTAGIEPVEKVLEAGAIGGMIGALPGKITTNSTIHVRP